MDWGIGVCGKRGGGGGWEWGRGDDKRGGVPGVEDGWGRQCRHCTLLFFFFILPN